jgi:hypothetical protein
MSDSEWLGVRLPQLDEYILQTVYMDDLVGSFID